MSEVRDGRIRQASASLLRRFVPAPWLAGYQTSWLRNDAIAGGAVAILLIPQALAYALLADLPPRVGLFAAIAPPLIYALFGTSRFLAVGPVALVSLMVAESIGSHSSRLGIPPVETALILSILVGLVLIIVGVARLGVLVQFISEPVLNGFAAGAAVLIASTQVRHLFGLDLPRPGGIMATFAQLRSSIDEIAPAALELGLAALLLLLLAGRPLSKLLDRFGLSEEAKDIISQSMPLIVVALSVTLLWTTSVLEHHEIPVVGAREMGFPPLTNPAFRADAWREMVPSAMAIAAIILVTAMAISRALGSRKRQRIDPDQELVALGLANVAASFSGGYPVGASISRSAVSFESGARTQMNSAIAAVLVAIAALFAGPLLAWLPKSVLAAIILSAVFGLIRPREILQIFRYSRLDGLSLVVTFLAVVFLGVEPGILIGATAGLALYIWRTSRPRVMERRPEEEPYQGVEASPVMVLDIGQDLYFANADALEQNILQQVADHGEARWLVLDFRGVTMVDVSAFSMLDRLIDHLDEAGVHVAISDLTISLQRRLERSGFIDHLGSERVFRTTPEAVRHLSSQSVPGAGGY